MLSVWLLLECMMRRDVEGVLRGCDRAFVLNRSIAVLQESSDKVCSAFGSALVPYMPLAYAAVERSKSGRLARADSMR